MGSKECVKVSLEWKFRCRYYTNIRHHWPKPPDDDRRWWKMQHTRGKRIGIAKLATNENYLHESFKHSTLQENWHFKFFTTFTTKQL